MTDQERIAAVEDTARTLTEIRAVLRKIGASCGESVRCVRCGTRTAPHNRTGANPADGWPGLRTAVHPSWGSLQIDDVFSDSASATKHVTVHVLAASSAGRTGAIPNGPTAIRCCRWRRRSRQPRCGKRQRANCRATSPRRTGAPRKSSGYGRRGG